MRPRPTAFGPAAVVSLWGAALWGQLASAERELKDFQVHADTILRLPKAAPEEASAREAGEECEHAEVRQHSAGTSVFGVEGGGGSRGPGLGDAEAAPGARDVEAPATLVTAASPNGHAKGAETLAATANGETSVTKLAPTEKPRAIVAGATPPAKINGEQAKTTPGPTLKCKHKPITSLKSVVYHVEREFANEANCGMGYYRVGPNLGNEQHKQYLCVSHRPEKGRPVTGVYLKAQFVAANEIPNPKPCGEDEPLRRVSLEDESLTVDVNPRVWWVDMADPDQKEGGAMSKIMPWNWPWYISVPRFFPFSNIGRAKQMSVCFTRSTEGEYAKNAAGFKKVTMPRSWFWSCRGGQVVYPGNRSIDQEAKGSIRSVSAWDLNDYFPKYTTFATNTHVICLTPNPKEECQ